MMETKSDVHPASADRGYWAIAILLLVVGSFAALAAADRAERYAAADRQRSVILGIASRLAQHSLDRHRGLLARLAEDGGLEPPASLKDLVAAAPVLDPELRSLAVLDAEGTILARSPGRIAPATFDRILAEAAAHAHGPGLFATAPLRDPELGID